jgi:competence protein ComGC
MKNFFRKMSAFTLAEIMLCMAIIGIVSIFWMSIANSRIDYGQKMGYWATVKNLQKGTNALMSEGTKDQSGNTISQLPAAANSGTTGFCNRMAGAYNTINGSVDCTAKATTSSNFKTIKPNFILSNGAVVYNLGSDPITTTTPIKTSSFLAFLLPEKNIKPRQIFVSALMQKQNEALIDDGGGGGGIVSSITDSVSGSVSAVKDAAAEAGSTSSEALSSASNLVISKPLDPIDDGGGTILPNQHWCEGVKDDTSCTCPSGEVKVFDRSTYSYDCNPASGGSGDSGQVACISGYVYSASLGKCVQSSTSLQCIDGYIKVGDKCVCNSDDCLDCGANSYASGGVCVCNSGYEKYNGLCVPQCATSRGYVHTGSTGTCACPSGQDDWNQYCVAPCTSAHAHHAGNAGTCACDTGYEMVNGTCVLPCSAGQVRNSSGQCVTLGPNCPANASFDGSQCVCNSGYERYNGSCVQVCASNEERVNGSCVAKCGANQTRNASGTCECNSGYDTFKGTCLPSCTNGKIRFYDGSCQCNYGNDWVASLNQCKPSCSAGQARNDSGVCISAASYYDIFVDVDGLSKGNSTLNKDVFEFWVSMNGNIYPAPTSAMADNKDLVTAQITYLDPHEKRVTLGTRYSYKEALCTSNTVDDAFVTLGYCGNYKPDLGHCHNGKNNNTCSVKLNLPGYNK